MNEIVDCIVPVYTVVVVFVLYVYATHPGKPFVRNYLFTAKRREGDSNKEKNWKDDLEGYW